MQTGIRTTLPVHYFVFYSLGPLFSQGDGTNSVTRGASNAFGLGGRRDNATARAWIRISSQLTSRWRAEQTGQNITKKSKRRETKESVEVGQTVPRDVGPHLKRSTECILIGVRRRRPDCKRQKSSIFLWCYTDIFNTSNQWSLNISHAPLAPNSKPAVTGSGLENSAAAEVRGWPQLRAKARPKIPDYL